MMITLSSLLINVDKSEQNTTWVDWHTVFRSLSMHEPNYDDFDEKSFDERVKQYWIKSWVCTDTRVGYGAIYVDSLLTAFFHQTARKEDENIDYISEESAVRMRDLLYELSTQSYSGNIIPFEALYVQDASFILED